MKIERLPLRRLGLLTLIALGLAACNGVSLFGDGTSSSSSGPPECTLPTACCGAGTMPTIGTDAGRTPDRPTGAPSAGSGNVVLALSKIYFGDTDRSDNPSMDAWQQFGLNIDDKVTGTASTDVCTPVGGSYCETQLDGNDGIDNSFGENVMPILGTLDSTFSTAANAALQSGDATMIVELDGAGAGPSYTPMTAGLLRAVPIASPLWNGADVRDIDTASLVDGAIARPASVFPDGYMNQRTWVGLPSTGTAWLDLHLIVGGHAMPPVPIQHVQIVMNVAADGSSATQGTLAGVIRTSDAVAWAELWALDDLKQQCSQDAAQSLGEQVAQASDIMSDGTNGPGQTCDGISVGLGFEAVAVQLGQSQAVAPYYNPCGQAIAYTGSADAGTD
jgi:hypothetical protein